MKRRGSTLVEVVVTVTVLAAVFATAGRALVLLLQSEGEAVHTLTRHSAVQRLAEDFRSDAHAATAARLLEQHAAKALTLERPDGSTVVYRSTPDGVVRLVFAGQAKPGGRADETAAAARELYRLSDVAVRFELSDGGRVVAVRLADAPGGTKASRNVRPRLVVRAAVGVDHRFATTAQRQRANVPKGVPTRTPTSSETVVDRNSRNGGRS